MAESAGAQTRRPRGAGGHGLMKDLSGSGLAGREVWAAFLQGLLCSAEFRYLL